jgi:Zn-dependent protease
MFITTEYYHIILFMQLEIIFVIAILILSVIIHEVCHGFAAERLGDPTARLAGRLNLNPLNHIDLTGSILVPLISYFLGGFVIGWAKPVPYNPYNLRNQRWGEAIVAASGPLANILIALIFGVILRFSASWGITNTSFLEIAGYVVFINLILAIFNLVPLPPLDGSKILFSVLPYRMQYIKEFLERNWLVVMAVFVFFLWKFISPIVIYIFKLLTGFSL